MNIVLIGYRGSGKTSVGRLVAERLGMAFVDVDDEICKRFGGQTIAHIWDAHGEPAFRATEVDVTRDLMAANGQVIGLGGGTVMQPGAREAIQHASDALRFYLRAAPAELCRRIHGDPSTGANRPALTAKGGGLEEIASVLADREPTYLAAADVVIDVDAVTIEAAAEAIVERVQATQDG